MKIQTVCVCGAGTMGSGIAQLCAQSSFKTILYDLDQSMIEKAKVAIENDLDLLVQKGKLDSTLRVMDLLQFTNNRQECSADLIIEAIVEKESIKVSLFKQLEKINSNDSILASNTSSLSITSI